MIIDPPHTRTPMNQDSVDSDNRGIDELKPLGPIRQKTLQPSKKWQATMRKQRRLDKLIRIFGAGKTSPLLWCVPESRCSVETLSAVQSEFTASQSRKKNAKSKRSRPTDEEHLPDKCLSPSDAILVIHRAQRAPWKLERAPLDVWNAVLDEWRRWVELPSTESEATAWERQLLEVELPLTVATQLPEAGVVDKQVAAAKRRLEVWIDREVGVDGFVTAQSWLEQRALFASWIRSVCLLKALKAKPLSTEARNRLIALFRNIQRATIADGQSLLVNENLSQGYGRLVRLAARMLDERPLLRDRRNRVRARAMGATSPASGITVLQSQWSPQAAKVAVQHTHDRSSIHVWRTRSLLFGELNPVVRMDGRELPLDGNWEVCCWHCDKDIQLVDLEMKLADGVLFSRTVALACRDQFLFMSDAVLADRAQSWEYEMPLPVAGGMYAAALDQTSEVELRKIDRIDSRLVPLAASEWRLPGSSVGLERTPSVLTLRQSSSGKNVFAPFWIDLHPSRSEQPLTWRELTVARNRKKVSQDAAVGYRIQAGNDQWLIFRAFDMSAPCSVLSKHLACEFYMGRIESDRSLTDLIHFA